MAAAILGNRQKRSVQSDLRYIGYDSITFTNNGDTWATPLKHIFSIDLTPTTSNGYGFTVSGGTLTFVGTAGTVFLGGVTGE